MTAPLLPASSRVIELAERYVSELVVEQAMTGDDPQEMAARMRDVLSTPEFDEVHYPTLVSAVERLIEQRFALLRAVALCTMGGAA